MPQWTFDEEDTMEGLTIFMRDVDKELILYTWTVVDAIVTMGRRGVEVATGAIRKPTVIRRGVLSLRAWFEMRVLSVAI
jgi:hypothetical protein